MFISSTKLNSLHGIVGHRGAAAHAPENTLASFKRAYADGADAIELDILKTRDGHFAIMHDDTVDRTTNGHGKVEDLTLEEIKKLDAGSWYDSKFAGEPVPELGEVLDWARDKIHVLIEVKRKTAEESDGKELVDLIREKRMSEQVTVMSFNHDFVERVEGLAPDLDTGVLCAPYKAYKTAGIGAIAGLAGGLAAGLMASGNPLVTVATTVAGAVGGVLAGRFLGMGEARRTARSTSADSLMPNWFIATPGLVEKSHAHNHGVVPYTVDKRVIASKLKLNGVDGFISNNPGKFV